MSQPINATYRNRPLSPSRSSFSEDPPDATSRSSPPGALGLKERWKLAAYCLIPPVRCSAMGRSAQLHTELAPIFLEDSFPIF